MERPLLAFWSLWTEQFGPLSERIRLRRGVYCPIVAGGPAGGLGC